MFPLAKLFLYPFAGLYGIIIGIRNFLYDKKILHAQSFQIPLINVGNLAVGGTGKTPHIEYLIRLLHDKYHIATLSRGYKRKSKGFMLADANSTAKDIGDEPFLFHVKYPHVTVAVGEERIFAIPEILHHRNHIDVILLDDAFQHRSVKPGLNILLTDYNKLFIHDYLLPIGSLRDSKSSYQRADIIIITKCPNHFNKREMEQKIPLLPHQRILCSSLHYHTPYLLSNSDIRKSIDHFKRIQLITGIASNESIIEYVKNYTQDITVLKYADHYYFEESDLENWLSMYQKDPSLIFLTTEKDATKLIAYLDKIKEMGLPIYILPIEVVFDAEDKVKFDDYILKYVQWEREKNGIFDSPLESEDVIEIE
ncbi:MAG: tetraacyldisaccharide 4'-kinase [Chitinophagales bacterium]|nr:tetraacyldisaccharide 4'-kinase [Chitinophagales bacterium]